MTFPPTTPPPVNDPDPPDLPVTRGTQAIDALLRTPWVDLRHAELPAFRGWLEERLPAWRRDPVFVQRERVREVRRANPAIRALERDRRRAAAADAQSPHGERLAALETELHGVSQAVAGLTAALAAASGGRRAALREKLDGFELRRAALAAERDRRIAASPERATLLRIDAELERLQRESGLRAAQERLDGLVAAQGRRAGRSGGSFEEAALRAVRAHVVPKLGDSVAVLAGVTLGAARVELDQVVVRTGAGAAVEVLAVVEAKHNANDLGHGFTRRQENLAWLAGHRAAYTPERHVTRTFPTGHFDRAVEHDGFIFDASSFRRFRPDPATGHFLAGLLFVTRPTPLDGLSGGALGRIRHRVATDTRFTLEDAYLEELLAWCRTLAEPIEAPDVLRLYATEPERARQVLWLG